MATAMLDGGADIRFVQEMLGHVSLATTQIYTRVSIEKLKAVHAATHPAARLTRSSTGVEPAEQKKGAGERTALLEQLEADEHDELDA